MFYSQANYFRLKVASLRTDSAKDCLLYACTAHLTRIIPLLDVFLQHAQHKFFSESWVLPEQPIRYVSHLLVVFLEHTRLFRGANRVCTWLWRSSLHMTFKGSVRAPALASPHTSFWLSLRLCYHTNAGRYMRLGGHFLPPAGDVRPILNSLLVWVPACPPRLILSRRLLPCDE